MAEGEGGAGGDLPRCRWQKLAVSCEHHSLPFFGHAYVEYIAHEEIIGQQITDTLEAMLKPHGVAVYLEAHHLCTQMRGVHAILPLTRTTFFRGEYDGNPALRAEFFTVCGL